MRIPLNIALCRMHILQISMEQFRYGRLDVDRYSMQLFRLCRPQKILRITAPSRGNIGDGTMEPFDSFLAHL